MPAIITHHLFGEDAAKRLPSHITFSQEELLAFLLGNQGPDPLYFCFTAPPKAILTCHEFAARMHSEKELDALLCVRDAVRSLPAADQGIGHAFALGLLAHYLLDSEAHAFIFAQEQAICDAGVGLEDAHAQVHALIESELDTWMLWSARQQTVDDAPAWADLARTERVSRVGGTLMSQIAWQVFGMRIGPDRYEGCLHDYELVYRAIDPTGTRRNRLIAGAERLGARYSILDALSHTNQVKEASPAANLECKPWVDALTGEEHHTSFPDVFYDTLDMWEDLVEAFEGQQDDVLKELVVRRYNGSPLD